MTKNNYKCSVHLEIEFLVFSYVQFQTVIRVGNKLFFVNQIFYERCDQIGK